MSDEIDDLFDALDDKAEKPKKKPKKFKTPYESAERPLPTHYYRWKKFVNEYLRNGHNAAGAYKFVYGTTDNLSAASGGRHLLERVEIQNMIEEQGEINAINCNIDLKYNAQLLHRLIDECIKSNDKHHLTKAIDILNKMGAAYTHKQEVDVKHTGIQFNYIAPTKDPE